MTRYSASPCPCGHKACHSWVVEPAAATQGVSFTEVQARCVAELLNRATEEEKEKKVEQTSGYPNVYALEEKVGRLEEALLYTQTHEFNRIVNEHRIYRLQHVLGTDDKVLDLVKPLDGTTYWPTRKH